ASRPAVGYDVVHPLRDRAGGHQERTGAPDDPADPGADRDRPLPHHLHHGPDALGGQRAGDSASPGGRDRSPGGTRGRVRSLPRVHAGPHLRRRPATVRRTLRHRHPRAPGRHPRLGTRARLRRVRAAGRVPDRFRRVRPVPRPRPGGLGGADVDGDDDAAARLHQPPPEAAALRPRRRVVADHPVARRLGPRDGDMTDAQVLDILVDALVVAAKLAGPFLISAAAIGIAVSLLQTITQVQEMTLTFVPKLIGAALILVFAGSWMLREVVTWVKALWTSIPGL